MAEILLTPEILIAQSAQMQTLGSEFESLFSQVTTVLNGMNDSWSENIATNFVSKILLAQQSFSSIVNMLENGSNAARIGAMSFANGVDMGQILDSVNSDLPVQGVMDGIIDVDDYMKDWLKDHDIGADRIMREILGDDGMRTFSEGSGNVKDNYLQSLGKYLDEDIKDIREMILGDKTPSYGEVAKKYGEMVWHYGISAPIKALGKTMGFDVEAHANQLVKDAGEVYASVTGDAGARDYFNEYYKDGYGKGVVNGIADTVDYLWNNTGIGKGLGNIWQSIVH